LLKRIKRRYIGLLIDSDSVFTEREFLDAVWAAIARLYGEYGASQTGLAPISFDEANKVAILRTSLGTLQLVRAAIASITRITGKDATVHVTSISGTLKSLREKNVTNPQGHQKKA
jgi:RNase P/RNase MRP subunit POP5